MCIYCLFCETERCDTLVRAATELFSCKVIYPKQVQHTWKDGKMIDRLNSLLPGYLFLYFEEPVADRAVFWKLNGVIRLLSDSGRNYELSGGDEAFALALLQKEGVIGKTQVYQEGDRIHIKEGAFAGLNCRILKVDHRHSRMQIEIPFVNQLVKTWVEYEIVEPDSDRGRNQTGDGSLS